jgi:hypothetical protein
LSIVGIASLIRVAVKIAFLDVGNTVQARGGGVAGSALAVEGEAAFLDTLVTTCKASAVKPKREARLV